MSEPAFVPLNVGNTHDDDARIIDEQFLEVDAPPTPLPTVTTTNPTDRPLVTNRTLIGTLIIPAGGFQQPTQILPLDRKRIGLAVDVRSLTQVATDFVRFGDDGNKLGSLMGSHIIFHGDDWDTIDFTGPVFVHGPDLSAACYITWCAITE